MIDLLVVALIVGVCAAAAWLIAGVIVDIIERERK